MSWKSVKARRLLIAGIILLAGTPCAMATMVNSNAAVVNDIEYYVQTDKAVYHLGENVEMLYRVTNLGSDAVTFDFPALPEWNFWVEKDGEGIWMAATLWAFVASSFTLLPSGYREFPHAGVPYVWDMRDSENNLVGAGEYAVIGGLDGGTYRFYPEVYDHTRVSVPITIVPEPASMVFLILGAGLMVRMRHFNSSKQVRNLNQT